MPRLENKVALVSGSARGIGAATVAAMVAEGAQVVIADLLDEEGHALAREIGPCAAYVHLDVTSRESWDAAVATAVAAFGKLNVLVNNAGIGTLGSVENLGRGDWDKVLAVNLTGAFNGIQAVLPAMDNAGGGSIVNLSSIAGISGVPGMAGYVASKWGVRGLTKAAALDLARYKIRVNSVHPGFVYTPMTAGEYQPGFDRVAMHRGADPSEIAALIVFLASDESSFSTGAEFVSDGGETAGNAGLFQLGASKPSQGAQMASAH
jgi:3alpha(or 20beta)-hydroxysteroid dehydrogenase